MFRMINPVQDYAWGSTSALTELFGWPPSAEPRAEVWMGAHPTAPSQVVLDEDGPETTSLDTLLADRPELAGAADGGSARAAGLPFLLKVLAAARPLSIQTHPDAERARAGFAAEDAAGIPRTDRRRCYPDPSPKPELLVALDEFAALSGFRDADEAAEDLEALVRLLRADGAGADGTDGSEDAEAVGSLADLLAAGDHHGALEEILRGRREEFVAAAERITRLLAPEAPALRADVLGRPGGLATSTADTLRRVAAAFPGDPGLLVTVLLQRVDLRPGEALFLPAGNLHAYLHGVGVEIMASSDNVLRGGLTGKHIDVDELLSVTEARRLPVPHCPPTTPAPGRRRYTPECRDFALERIELPEAGSPLALADEGPAVLLCTAGELVVERLAEEVRTGSADGAVIPRGAARLRLRPGQSAYLPATARHRLVGGDSGQAFLATRGAVAA
ncbi:mannose-6-phosphate isomerase, class I [Nesterenkonia halophila]|uniref:mannose-6-phosphate isomerase, class I n=1 Tax=Nesterenkonia halophila TaxID=302044 RepID=UPI001478B6CA|nr:mannose-6-phosphate isomerase, class I [Nesterenkonia halophila]